jgi:uncharacterized protein YdaU (DUF1376 family)
MGDYAGPVVDEQPGPSFPFYSRDWLAGQGTTAMTPEQKGAFIDLLAHAHQSRPPCTLPDDDDVLAKLSGLGAARWKKVGSLVRAQFLRGPDGLLRNRKQWGIYQELLAYRDQKRQAGSRSAVVRRQRFGTAQPNDPPNEHPNTPTNDAPNAQSNEVRTDNRTPPEPAFASALASASAPALKSERENSRPARMGGPIIGRNPHLEHAACDDTLSRCVPAAVHRKLADALAPRYGGDRDAAKAALERWYADVWATLPADFVMGEAFRFWQSRFDAQLATKEATPARNVDAAPRPRDCDHEPRCTTERIHSDRLLGEMSRPESAVAV